MPHYIAVSPTRRGHRPPDVAGPFEAANADEAGAKLREFGKAELCLFGPYRSPEDAAEALRGQLEGPYWSPRAYACLADAARRTGDARYRGGSVGVWYARPGIVEQARSIRPGRRLGLGFTRKRLPETHVFLGTIEAEDLDTAFALMNGDVWSPRGAASAWLEAIGVGHTSCFVGDVFDFRGRLYVVELEGFTELPEG